MEFMSFFRAGMFVFVVYPGFCALKIPRVFPIFSLLKDLKASCLGDLGTPLILRRTHLHKKKLMGESQNTMLPN